MNPKNVSRVGANARLLAGRRGIVATVHATLVWLVLLPVAVYRRVLSPLKRTSTCRFMPTCSAYAIEAVHKRGIVVGGALASWRILRCNPLFRGGYDPVPCRHCEELNAGSR